MTTKATKAPRPYYRELSDEGLQEAYLGLRSLAWVGGQVRDPNLGRILRDLDLVVCLARKRGLSLLG